MHVTFLYLMSGQKLNRSYYCASRLSQGESPRRKNWGDNRDFGLVLNFPSRIPRSYHSLFLFWSLSPHLTWLWYRYEYINDVILDHLDDEIKSTDRSGVWRYLISFKVPFFSFLFKKAKIFLILPPESPLGHREHWDCVCVWDPLPEHWNCHSAELYQVVIVNE